MAAKYIHKFPTTAALLAAAADRTLAQGIGAVSDIFYINVAGVAKALIDASTAQTMTNKTLTSPVLNTPIITNSIINHAPIVLSAISLTLAAATHDHRTVVVTKTDGTTITLPAATGSGALFRVVQGAKVASSATVFQVASGTDYIRGASYAATDNGSGAGLTWPTTNTATVATESDTMTWNGGTQGGNIGDTVEFEDIAAAVWTVKAWVDSTGTEATPFSAAV